MFYRNYTPSYTQTPSEKLADIKKMVAESYHKIYIEENPQPYNCKGVNQNIDIKHLTMWYDTITDKAWIMHLDKEHRDNGYTIIEVSTAERSVDYPHKHYLKINL